MKVFNSIFVNGIQLAEHCKFHFDCPYTIFRNRKLQEEHGVDKLDIGFVPPSKTGGLACSNSTDTRKHDKG